MHVCNICGIENAYWGANIVECATLDCKNFTQRQFDDVMALKKKEDSKSNEANHLNKAFEEIEELSKRLDGKCISGVPSGYIDQGIDLASGSDKSGITVTGRLKSKPSFWNETRKIQSYLMQRHSFLECQKYYARQRSLEPLVIADGEISALSQNFKELEEYLHKACMIDKALLISDKANTASQMKQLYGYHFDAEL